jgi:hypothetical protein
MTTPQPSWREERRLDRLAAAQVSRDAEAARTRDRIAEAEARARLQRDDRQGRRADRRAARKLRANQRAERVAWLRAHVTDLLFVPVIVVPGVLAWTAMAAYGLQVFGPPGVSLPAFSEGAMWAFAGATTITRRRHPERPAWHLRLGTALFAGFGAALNFAHGLAAGSVITGAVMALISVAGVVAHQLITAGPRRSRAGRAAARDQRAIARRERAIRRAALRRATAVLGPDGNARLIFRPGIVKLARSLGRTRLEPVPSSPVWLPWPMVLPGSAEPATALLLDMQAAEAVTAYRGWRSTFMAAPSSPDQVPRKRVAAAPSRTRPVSVPGLPAAPQTEPVLARAESFRTAPSEAPQTSSGTRSAAVSNRASNGGSKPAGRKAQKTALRPSEKRARAEQMLRDNPGMSTAELAGQSGVSKATAARIRAQSPTRLRVAR